MADAALRWVNPEKTPAKVYITRVFNFGTWEEWQRMKQEFHPVEIREAIENPLPGQWTRRAKNFAEILYSCKMPQRALISYEAA